MSSCDDDLKKIHEPPLLKENRFREKTNDMFAYPRELDQAVTFLHENGEWGEWGVGRMVIGKNGKW